MRLIYEKTGEEVKAGDLVSSQDGELFRLDFYREPHKPSSTGRVYVTRLEAGCQLEFFPSVIGAKWIERTDGWVDYQLEAQG